MLENVQVASFCNTQIRPMADRATGFFSRAQLVLLQWQNIAASVPNDATVIDDGSATDGRTPITGADVWAFIGGLETYLTTIQANNNALINVTTKISVNPQV